MCVVSTWNHTCRVFNSSEKKSCQVHIFSHFAFYILVQTTQFLRCVFRVCGSEICCGRFCRSSARTCDSRDCSLNTRTSWSCCAINNTPTRLESPLNQYGLSKTLPVPLKPDCFPHLLLKACCRSRCKTLRRTFIALAGLEDVAATLFLVLLGACLVL